MNEIGRAVFELRAIFQKTVGRRELLGNSDLNSIEPRRSDSKRYLLYICIYLFTLDCLDIVLFISALFGRCFGLYFGLYFTIYDILCS